MGRANIEMMNREMCCGCMACAAICPKKCISMALDEEGFAYPRIEQIQCSHCGKCLEVCPFEGRNCEKYAKPVQAAYSVNNLDNEIRALGTSGGAFSAIASYVIERDGVVFGVKYDDDYNVVHDVAYDLDSVSTFYGSKYVQSDLSRNSVMGRVEEFLVKGRIVLFSGTPCQVHALQLFLGRDYQNLITCDFVCRAVPSRKAWNLYCEMMESKYQSKIVNVVFRNKTYGYHAGSMKLEFANGEVYYGSARVDYMQKAFFADVISRPSCYHCAFRSLNMSSDFTIFDCWNYSSHTGLCDDDLGHTNVWVRGERGSDLYPIVAKYLDSYEVEIESTLLLDGRMATNDIKRNDVRDVFLHTLVTDGFDAAVRKYLPVSAADRAFEAIRGPLQKIGVLKMLKSIKKKIRKADRK